MLAIIKVLAVFALILILLKIQCPVGWTMLISSVTVGFVGITFPVLLPFIVNDGANLYYIMFVFASGFAGVLLSPVHVCLILTKDYFQADI